VPVVPIRSSSKQPIHPLSIDPKENVGIDSSVPLLGTNAVRQGSLQDTIIHRLLIAQDGNAVGVVSYRYELPSIAALESSARRVLDTKQVEQRCCAEKPDTSNQIPIIDMRQVVQP